MFQNSYQNGSYFDFFDPKANADKLKPLFKTTNLPANAKVFDKDLKTYVIQSLSPNAKIAFPKQDKKDLYLIQQYLVFHIYFFPSLAWSIELTVSDLTKTKRRIILSPATTKLQIKPFFVKEPCRGWKEGAWNNFSVDLYSYMEAFKGQTYRSLDAINISGYFKLRRIYTSTEDPLFSQDQLLSQEVKPINFLPKQFHLPLGVACVSYLNKFEADAFSHTPSEVTEHSTKNSSFLKSSKTKSLIPTKLGQQELFKGKSKQKRPVEVKMEQVKSEQSLTEAIVPKAKVETKKRKDFLSDTNGDLIARNKQRISLDKNAQSQKIIISNSTKPVRPKPKEINNPWRSSKESQPSVGTHSTIPRREAEPDRKAFTPESSFKPFKKTKNQRQQNSSSTSKRGQILFSDSEYVQLSQKFSTITDGKFFKNEPPSHLFHKPQPEDEIEQNIEMETNSHLSDSRKEQHLHQPPRDCSELIRESIGDSLDGLEGRRQKIGQGRSRVRERGSMIEQERNQMQELGNSSLYGFGNNLMKNFMQEVERPYSPPIGQRENSQADPVSRVSKDEVQLIYDPVLNCYYDYRTHTYYQLKN